MPLLSQHGVSWFADVLTAARLKHIYTLISVVETLVLQFCENNLEIVDQQINVTNTELLKTKSGKKLFSKKLLQNRKLRL